jgi:hypothetical protein
LLRRSYNHPDGKAAVSALELKYLLTGKKVKGPETLVAQYPRIAEFVTATTFDTKNGPMRPLF